MEGELGAKCADSTDCRDGQVGAKSTCVGGPLSAVVVRFGSVF